ncbi:MAG: ABC transporter ATP-binding protein, partial [Ktedonobacterales bacterium]
MLRPYRGRLVVAGVLLVATGGLSLLFPLVIRGLLDTILVQRDERLLNLVALALLIVFALQMLLGSAQSYLVTSIGERLTVDLRIALFRHLQRLPISFFDQRRTGELMSRVTNDVTVLQTSLTGNLLPVVSQVLTLVGSVAIAVTIDWRIALVILAVAPPAGILAAILGRRIRRTTRGVQEGLGSAGIVLEETLGAPRVVKAFGRETYEDGRFTEQIGQSLRQALRRAATQSVIGPLIGFISFISVVIVLWFGGREVLAGRLTAGALVAFLIYLALAVGPLVSLTSLYSQLQTAQAAGERVFALLDEPVEVSADMVDAPAMPPIISGQVAFEHVSFAYPVGASGGDASTHGDVSNELDELLEREPRGQLRQVLRDVTFEAQPGQVVALVGPSGAGKTTTLSLLLRFYELDGGAIRVDGVDIGRVQAQSLREQIAIVPQEPTLFGDSIGENI